MAVVEYSRENWFQRIGKAIKGVVVGFIMFLIAFPVLFWNEGRAVHTARVLEEGAAAVVPVDSASVSLGNDGKLVHFTANTANASGKTLSDPKLNVEAPKDAVRLKRTVEMYQWKENKKEEKKKDGVGGAETTKTTTTYEKVWSEKPIDSSSFKESGHGNPQEMRFKSDGWDASKVTAGAFTLPPELVEKIDNYSPLAVTEKTLDVLPDDVKENAVVSDDLLYLGRDGKDGKDGKPSTSSPVVGDLRVTFKTVQPGPVSVIAMQKPAATAGGPNLGAYTTKNGPLQLLYVGTHTAPEMFASEQQKNTLLTWVLRLVGFLLMWIGLAVALDPLKVLADVIGILGDIAGVGIGLVTLVIALCLSFLTIAIAWITYRPVVGIGLLAVAAFAAFLFIWLRRRGAARRVVLAPAVPAYAGTPG